jgi:uncharacterized membrane protein YphA (DoxX/SURF4 family)
MPMLSQDSSRRLSWGILFIRILVGWVFLSEGIQKFLFPAALGTGRFANIGIPWPQFPAPAGGGVLCSLWVKTVGQRSLLRSGVKPQYGVQRESRANS